MSFQVHLPLFDGPFDLLLFFIERDELDIHDIPISQITAEFLDYLQHLDTLEIEVASEFILVAATLMRIKAKMLLPRPQLDEHGAEIDPREELVARLLEYKRYKEVLSAFQDWETSQLDREKRGNVVAEVQKLAEENSVEAELQSVDLYKLLRVYARTLERQQEREQTPSHQVVQYPYTVSGQKQHILRRVGEKGRLSFTDLLEELPERVAMIFNFLAILELVQLRELDITVGEGFNNFWLESAPALAA